jgi:hypothetical protein
MPYQSELQDLQSIQNKVNDGSQKHRGTKRQIDLQITQDSEFSPLPGIGSVRPTISQPLKPIRILKNKDQLLTTTNTDRLISDLHATKESWRLQQLSLDLLKSNQAQQAISSKLGGMRD